MTVPSAEHPTRIHPGTVAVVLVNHGQYARQHLADCYASLTAQTYPSALFTIFIVNNEAIPADGREVARLAPAARILTNAANCGWAGGNNTAIRVALREGYRYLVMLNMDTVVEPTWLEELVAAAERSPDAHILQSKIMLYGTNQINSIGNRIQYLGFGFCSGYREENHRPVPRLDIDYASGAAMLVRREVFETVGLFRDDYFMYYDDTEFCWRAKLAGFNAALAEESVCYHKYDFNSTLQWLYYLERNRWLTLLTLSDVRTLLLTFPCHFVAQGLLGAYFLTQGRGRVYADVACYFLRRATWKQITARRRHLRSLRIRKDAEIVRGFAGGVLVANVTNPPLRWTLRYLCNPLLRGYWAVAKRLMTW